MPRGRLFVVAGPSGVGKGTLIQRLLQRYPTAWLSISATTRKPRPGEARGVEYHYLDEEEFMQLVAEGEFLEWAQVHGNLYGTPASTVEQQLAAGRDVILEIDVQGARQVREKMPDAVSVFVDTPSLEVLEERLRGRGTEDDEEIGRRLRNAREESLEKGAYSYVVLNDDLHSAAEELYTIYEKESLLLGGAEEDDGRSRTRVDED